VDGSEATRYFGRMSQTLEQRVDKLEKQVTALTHPAPETTPRRPEWQQTFGLSRDDAGFAEMIRLGREYRKNPRDQDCLADS